MDSGVEKAWDFSVETFSLRKVIDFQLRINTPVLAERAL
jgi:hypothetical protein